MVNQIYFHNNKTMNYVLANINYGSGLPLTSEGEGEIYYNTVNNTLYLNTGTAGTPSWRAIGGNKVITGDHGTATADEVINVCYGTSATPPTASTTTEGALYIQYTA